MARASQHSLRIGYLANADAFASRGAGWEKSTNAAALLRLGCCKETEALLLSEMPRGPKHMVASACRLLAARRVAFDTVPAHAPHGATDLE